MNRGEFYVTYQGHMLNLTIQSLSPAVFMSHRKGWNLKELKQAWKISHSEDLQDYLLNLHSPSQILNQNWLGKERREKAPIQRASDAGKARSKPSENRGMARTGMKAEVLEMPRELAALDYKLTSRDIFIEFYRIQKFSFALLKLSLEAGRIFHCLLGEGTGATNKMSPKLD